MSHAEGGLEAAARLGRSKKVKEAAETWHWPPSSLRHPVTAAYRCVTISVLCLCVPCSLVDGTPRTLHLYVICVTLCLI